MGLFSRRKTPTAPTPPASQTAAIAYPSQPYSSPPPYLQYTRPQPTSLAANYAPLWPPQGVACPQGSGLLSARDDFNAVQQALNLDAITDQFSNIITNIDEGKWNENDDDFSITLAEEPDTAVETSHESTRAIIPSRDGQQRRRLGRSRAQKVTMWTKVSFYSNSKLPADLPALRVYIPTWPLICLAAQYSANAYKAPASSKEKEAFVSADARLGTKAMVMKSVPCDDKKTLVFAIRGTSTLSLRDWNVNLHTAPVSPVGFLDDEGNLCHDGFLRVAKAMVKPIAMRLRTLLEENPSRASCSLLITGHSAGGAVAALLYSHMLSSVESELSILTGCFKRVHCVTFGAPPVSLLPLSKPSGQRYHKSLFFSFINEGDPVVRADKGYIRSLVDLLSSPLPLVQPQRKPMPSKSPFFHLQQSMSRLDLSLSKVDLSNTGPNVIPAMKNKYSRMNCSQPNISFANPPKPTRPPSRSHSWRVPIATLSNHGRIVVLRVPPHVASHERKGSQALTSIGWERNYLSKVTAHTVTDEQLRRVIFGDPAMHAMEVYLRRVEMLALKAVTARDGQGYQ